jgi:hypothetical protein
MTEKVREMGSKEKEALKLKRNQEPKDNAGRKKQALQRGELCIAERRREGKREGISKINLYKEIVQTVRCDQPKDSP